ncbi:hypothetical protein Btru_038329 [Bulinus truncatus]|nr:hypothetical protein Btru_038329 [Bulinus truncatus]
MASVLEQKLSVLADSDRTQKYISCINEEVIGHSCDTSVCLRLQLPDLLRDRVAQLITPEHFHLSDNITRVLRSMRDQVPGTYDLIIVTAVSSNHFDEMMSMISNVRVNLLPRLKNFTFIVYNLGLEDNEVSLISSNCDCHVVNFPFDQLSPFMGYVKCYTWKPLIVSAHISQTNLLLWADASIRFHQNMGDTFSLLSRARARGLQVGVSHTSIAHVTLQPMFQFFGDEACSYLPYRSSFLERHHCIPQRGVCQACDTGTLDCMRHQ